MTSSRTLASFLLSACACAAAQPRFFESVEPHMGTLVRIQLYAADAAQAKSAFQSALQRIRALDQTLSDYLPDSELNRLCAAAIDKPVAVSPDLFRILSTAQALAEETGGAFDITLGPLTKLWRAARKEGRLPRPAELEDARARCGFRHLHLDPVRATAQLDRAGMQLDAGGIAKGYAASAAIDVLRRLGIRSALVAVSGDLAFSDPPPGKRGWRIGIQSGEHALELANGAVSTSGDLEQNLTVGGTRYSHILNPATGVGLTHATIVTVAARDGIEADALATAVSVLGPLRGIALIRKHGAAAYIVQEDRRPQTVNWPPRFLLVSARSR